MNRDGGGMADKARASFERAVGDLPVATANRLRLARRNALVRDAGHPASARIARWRIPLAAAAVVLLGLGWWRQSEAPIVAPSAPVAARAAPAAAPPSLPMLANEDEADLYDWLAEAPVATDERTDGAL
jgi:hypothetical protein